MTILITSKYSGTNEYGDAIVFKERGYIYFHFEQWTMQYKFDMSNYIQNMKIIQNCTNIIESLCVNQQNGTTTNCMNFFQLIQQNTKNIQNDINQIIKPRKIKRSFKGFGKSLAKTIGKIGATTFITGAILYPQIKKNSDKLEFLKNKDIELSKLEANLMEKHLNLHEYVMADISEELQNIKNKQDFFSTEFALTKLINDYIHVISLAIIKHNQESRYWNDIIEGIIKPHFFDIINEETFLKDLENIQHESAENFSLPIDLEKNNLQNVLDISNLKSDILQNNTIGITISMPLVSKQQITLFEYIPVPIKVNSSIMLLDIESGFLTSINQNINHINEKILNKCSRLKNITICKNRSPILNSPVDMCMFSLFIKKQFSQQNCKLKLIPFDNYFIQTSNNEIFCTVIKPITIHICCGNNINDLIFLKSSKEISINDACILGEIENQLQITPKNNRTSSFYINSPIMNSNITISISDEIKNETKPPILDRYKLKFLEMSEEWQKMNKKIDEKYDGLDNIGDSFNFSEWPNKIYEAFGALGLIGSILTLVIILIIVIIFIVCCIRK